jgi:hypothetical protein
MLTGRDLYAAEPLSGNLYYLIQDMLKVKAVISLGGNSSYAYRSDKINKAGLAGYPFI